MNVDLQLSLCVLLENSVEIPQEAIAVYVHMGLGKWEMDVEVCMQIKNVVDISFFFCF